MQIQKHIDYFTKALNSTKISAFEDRLDVRIVTDNFSFFINDKYVRVLLNCENGIQDSTVRYQKPQKVTALSLMNLLSGDTYEKFYFTETEEEYFQQSTITDYVYPPEVKFLIQKIVDRWISENGSK